MQSNFCHGKKFSLTKLISSENNLPEERILAMRKKFFAVIEKASKKDSFPNIIVLYFFKFRFSQKHGKAKRRGE